MKFRIYWIKIYQITEKPIAIELLGLASLSELVYEDFQKKENLKKNIEFLRMKLEKIYDKKDTQAILVSNKDFLVLAFRGTETNSIKDI